MAYTDWDVVAFEQPTAAKWNQLGDNDAGLRDGSNVLWNNNQEIQAKSSGGATKKLIRLDNDDYIRLSQFPRQDNTTNSVKEDVLIQYGYGVMATGAASSKIESVTFPKAFSSAPIVLVVSGGDDIGGATTLGAGGNEDQGSIMAKAYSVTTTGFDVRLMALANWGAGTTVFYHWIAIGEAA